VTSYLSPFVAFLPLVYARTNIRTVQLLNDRKHTQMKLVASKIQVQLNRFYTQLLVCSGSIKQQINIIKPLCEPISAGIILLIEYVLFLHVYCS